MPGGTDSSLYFLKSIKKKISETTLDVSLQMYALIAT